MSDDLTTLQLDQFYPHPPAKVWRALTTPELMQRWLMESDGFEPRVGQEFTLRARPVPATNFSGLVSCRVLEVVEPERLSFTWADPEAAVDTDWVLTWDLHPEGRGTRLVLTHSGFDPDDPTQQLSRTIMGSGWPRVLRALDQVLSTP